MRGSTLETILDIVRAEARLSQNTAHNVQVRDSHIRLIQREQVRLWEDHDWPHLRVERLLPTNIGQRFYDPPAELDVDRIENVQYKVDNDWIPVDPGIGAAEYAIYDSALGQTANPIRRWRIWEGEQIEVWPVPDETAVALTQEGYIKLTGIRRLNPLVADNDTADLDDYLIALYVAGGILAASGAKDANLKIEMANKRLSKLTANMNAARRISMFGTGSQRQQRRHVITNYRAP